jgi:hypothetical protein
MVDRDELVGCLRLEKSTADGLLLIAFTVYVLFFHVHSLQPPLLPSNLLVVVER